MVNGVGTQPLASPLALLALTPRMVCQVGSSALAPLGVVAPLVSVWPSLNHALVTICGELREPIGAHWELVTIHGASLAARISRYPRREPIWHLAFASVSHYLPPRAQHVSTSTLL